MQNTNVYIYIMSGTNYSPDWFS